MSTLRLVATAGTLLLCVATGAPYDARAASETEPTTEELIERERIRPRVEAIVAELNDPRPGDDAPARFARSVTELSQLGPAVGPFMEAELDLPSSATFNIACYVMGRVNPPGGIEALRRAYDAAEREGGPFAQARKVWAAYGLAVAGDPSVVDLVNSGDSPPAWFEFMEDTRLIEVVAMLTAPESRRRLLAQLTRFDSEENLHPRLDLTLLALGRVGEASDVGAIAAFLKHGRPQVRAMAAQALGRVGNDGAVESLFTAMKDPDGRVRSEAAIALHAIRPSGRTKALLSLLETVDDPGIRGWVYRTLLAGGDESMIDALRIHARRPNGLDRTLLAVALGESGSRRALNILRGFLTDRDTNVAVTAVRSLGRIGGDGATDTLLALLTDPRWPVAQTAIGTLVDMRERRAASRIADRLVAALERTVEDVGQRDPIGIMAGALVDLGFSDRLDDIAAGAARQKDPRIVASLSEAVSLMRELRENRDDPGAWSRALATGDSAVQRLAARRLGEIGTRAAVDALVAAYGSASGEGPLYVLEALGATESPKASSLFRLVMEDPIYDTPDPHVMRATAAWGLRRLRDDASIATLRSCAERREGQDYPVLLYLAAAAGRDAVPVLRTLFVSRLRYFTWERGAEQARLERLIRELEAGRSIAAYDVGPDELDLH